MLWMVGGIVYPTFPNRKPLVSLGTLLSTQSLHCDWVIKKHISKIFRVSAQCFVTISYFWLFSHFFSPCRGTLQRCDVVGKIEWTTVPWRLIISWILSACSLWWGLTEGLTGENDVVFSVGRTGQVPLRQLLHRYEVYINHSFFGGPQGSMGGRENSEQGKWVTPRSKWGYWGTLKDHMLVLGLSLSILRGKATHFTASRNSRNTWNEV